MESIDERLSGRQRHALLVGCKCHEHDISVGGTNQRTQLVIDVIECNLIDDALHDAVVLVDTGNGFALKIGTNKVTRITSVGILVAFACEPVECGLVGEPCSPQFALGKAIGGGTVDLACHPLHGQFGHATLADGIELQRVSRLAQDILPVGHSHVSEWCIRLLFEVGKS